MTYEIRRAVAKELKQVQDLNHQLFLSDFDKDPDMNLNWPYEDGEQYFVNMINGTSGVCYVAVIEGEIVGYLAGGVHKSVQTYRPVKRSELQNMFVKKPYRSKGIGEALANQFVQWSREKGATHLYVSAYFMNERAIKFYKRVGFIPFSLDLEMNL